MKTGPIGMLTRFLQFRHRCKPKHGYGIHSPYVFDLLTKVIEPDPRSSAFEPIEQYRNELKHSKLTIDRHPIGGELEPSISSRRLAQHVAVPPHMGRLLFRLCQHAQPQNIVELGTSVGISTLYMATAAPGCNLHTIEAEPNVLDIARNQFKQLNYNNIHTHLGTFVQQLPPLLRELPNVGFALVDGHHHGPAMVDYTEQLMAKATPSTIIVLDDIRWSSSMEAAWQHLREHPAVSLSIDLFRCGLLLFRQGMVKQHFCLRFGPY